MRGKSVIRDCRRVLIFALFLIPRIGFSQNLESESYYTINPQAASVSSLDFKALLIESLDGVSEVLEGKFVELTSFQHHTSAIPHVDPYKRLDHFGRWVNDPTDDSCYNTRGLVLERDSQTPVSVSPNNHCKVEGGTWLDPYTNKKVKLAKEIQIDHIVPLKNAYNSGAFKWDQRTRCLYANYLGNDYHLLSVQGHENMSKGDRSPADYMPPLQEFRCTYLKIWLKVKLTWGLNMSDYEADGVAEAIKDNHCQLSTFKMSLKELANQRKIIKQSEYVCRK